MSRRLKAIKLGLLFSDLVLAVVAFQGAYILRFQALVPNGPVLPGTAWFVPIILFTFYVLDVYNPWSGSSGFRFHFRVIPATFAAWGALSLFAFMFYGYAMNVYFGRGVLFIAFFLYLPAVFTTRYFAARLVDPRLRPVRWLVIGKKDYYRELFGEIQKRGGYWHLEFVGLSEKTGRLSPKKRQELEGYLREPWTGIILAGHGFPSEVLMQVLEKKHPKVPVYNLLQFYGIYFAKVPLFYVNESIIGPIQRMWDSNRPVTLVLKEVSDRILAVFFLVFLSPLLFLLALLVRLESRGPVFYKQKRRGFRGGSFLMIKFRSMHVDAEKNGPKAASKGDLRITRMGRIMRVTHLDELPQLWNIAKGEMSFVGPRPDRIYLADLFAREVPYYNLRYSVKPGLTGWAQIHYPYGATIENTKEKLSYDLYYLRNFSFLLDLIIMIKTTRTVVFRLGR